MSDKRSLAKSGFGNRPIGIFDSGLGGLTVVKELIRILPNENLIYLGDTARVPYGTRSKETIIKFSKEDADFLLGKKVKCIVIACNTASSMAGNILKKNLKVPVFDVIGPALKKAKEISGKGKIGTIGTRATIGSGAYQKNLKIQNSKFKIFAATCPLFVPFIEEGEIDSPALKIIVKKYLEPLKKAKIDTLIMGCTHYPIIENLIQKEIGLKVNLVNPGESVSAEVKIYLTEHRMLSGRKKDGKRQYYVTDLTDRFKKVAEMFLGHPIRNLAKVNIDK